MDTSGVVCIHKLAIAVASSVVLLIQVVFGVALAFICQRYRKHKSPHFKASLDISKSTPRSTRIPLASSDISASEKSHKNSYNVSTSSPRLLHRPLPASPQESHT
jgi:hypothetical protein